MNDNTQSDVEITGAELQTGWLARVRQWLPIALVAVVLVRLVFFITYPPNTGGDCIGYYRMLIQGRSNLIHAPGYPFLAGLPLRTLLSATNTEWLIGRRPALIQYAMVASQHALSIAALLYLFHTVARIFSRRVASLVVLLHGLYPPTMGWLSSFYPEWMQADLLVVSLCTAYWAGTRRSVCGRTLLAVLAWIVFAWCYLVKFNALFFIPSLALLFVTFRGGLWHRLVPLAAGGLAALLTVQTFAHTFHLRSTGTADLSYDHAWVLLTSMGAWVPEGRLHPEAGIATKRLIYLNSVLPWEPERAGPVWNVNEVSDDFRKPWREKYRHVLTADEEVLDGLLETIPPALDPYDFFTAYLPVSRYLGFAEGDKLGVAVFKEHALRFLPSFAGHALKRFLYHLWKWPFGRLYPVELGADAFEAAGRGFYRQTNRSEHPWQDRVWYIRPLVWRPGTFFVRVLEWPYRLPSLLVVFVLGALGTTCLLRLRRKPWQSSDWAVLYLLVTAVVFVGASHLVFFRWKEAQTIQPLLMVLCAVAIDRAWAWAAGMRGMGASGAAGAG